MAEAELYEASNSPYSFSVSLSCLQLLRALFERALNITHDLSLTSIAFPFIGTGVLQYPVLDVMKALLDACSLFREKDSTLKTVSMLVWSQDKKTEQVIIYIAHIYSGEN